MKDKFLKMMAEVLEKEEGSVHESDIFRDYAEWDSLSVLAVMAMINEEYGIVISSQLFKKAETIDQLFALISEKIV